MNNCVDEKHFGEITNIEQWYFNRLKELKEEKKDVMENDCPHRHGLKSYMDTPACADENGDISSCTRCWNEIIK